MGREWRPNIVWITVESTRADHTTLGGYERDTTPNLERIAERARGRSFSGCFSHGVWTLPSSASILTGTVPSYHDAGMGSEAIPDELPTVPELLSERGYHTACLSPNSHLSSATGLDRGFDEFVWVSKSTLREAVGLRTLLKYLLNVRSHGGGLTLDSREHNPDFMMHDLAKRRLRSFRGRQPFFLYLHHGGPHRPYLPPKPYRKRFADGVGLSPAEMGEVALDHHANLFEHVANGCPFTDEQWRTLRALYDGEIAHVDALVGELFDAVRGLGLDETVFVVTSDHGELFGERGLLAHQIVVHDAVAHVPLVVHGFDDLLEYDGGMVQHADLVATLLGRMGVQADHCHGIDLREGRRDYSVVQRGEDRCRKNLAEIRAFDPAFDASSYHRATLHAIRTRAFKYQRSVERAELFRLPDEDRDVSASYPAVAANLDDRLSRWLETKGSPLVPGRVDGQFTDAMREQLADLGYLVE